MSEVLQIQDDLRRELEWAKNNGYNKGDFKEILDAYKDEYPGYSYWFNEVAQEFQIPID